MDDAQQRALAELIREYGSQDDPYQEVSIDTDDLVNLWLKVEALEAWCGWLEDELTEKRLATLRAEFQQREGGA